LWVRANFKETELTRLRSGQLVTIAIDTYPDRQWTGRVGSISPGSGEIFSLLPPQNASGNWVKVTQRIPVHIDLDAAASGPILRAGMSAEVSVYVGNR
jgi:membrane fusion protein (multidrug efflux system)